MRLELIVLTLLVANSATAQTPDFGSGDYAKQLEELRARGIKVDETPAPVECRLGLAEIDLEKAKSERALFTRSRTPELKEQYEQEMYFADQRIRIIDSICRADGVIRLHDFGRSTAVGNLEINSQACAIVAKDCQPRKHW